MSIFIVAIATITVYIHVYIHKVSTIVIIVRI